MNKSQFGNSLYKILIRETTILIDFLLSKKIFSYMGSFIKVLSQYRRRCSFGFLKFSIGCLMVGLASKSAASLSVVGNLFWYIKGYSFWNLKMRRRILEALEYYFPRWSLSSILSSGTCYSQRICEGNAIKSFRPL